MKKFKTVYCIIVTYNGIKWIEKCLNSLKNSNYPLKVIIIDNHSTDNTCEIIETKFPEFKLVKSEENLGFGKANNIGIEMAYQAGADYFFLLNQDAYITPDTIGVLVQSAIKEPEYGIISPMHLNGAGDAFDFNFANYYIIPKNCPNLYSDIYLNKIQDKLYETDFVNAAAWLISKKCIKDVGGFNPVFYHYGEDNNYLHRAIYHGFKVGINPKAQIMHDRENGKTSNSEEYQLFNNRKNLLIEISNPALKNVYYQKLKITRNNIFKGIIKINTKQIKNEYDNYIFLKKIKKAALSNKKKSLKKGINFLNER